jgi:hypothetical protein
MTAVHKVMEYVSSHVIRGPMRALSLPMTLTSTPLHLYWARQTYASATSHSQDPRTNGTCWSD